MQSGQNSRWLPHVSEPSREELPEVLRPLVEDIAERIHDVWAARRIKEGWSYGEGRSDELRQTPNLVPFGCLPESEREYDRAVAIEALRSIRDMGFEIRAVGKDQ